MMSNIKDYSKVYYLHRNDVRYKKILRGAKKYFMDALQKQTNFSNKDRNASDRLARIQNHITQYWLKRGLNLVNPNFAIFLTAFLFPREIQMGLKSSNRNSLLQGIFRECFNPSVKSKIEIIVQTIVKFSTSRLKQLLNIEEMNFFLREFLENGADMFMKDSFYSDICIELKNKVECEKIIK